MMALGASCACKGPSTPNRVLETQAAADSADHVMFTMKTILTNLGVKQADLEADSAFMYEAAGRTELRRVKLTFFNTTGVQQSTLTADEGTYLLRGNTMEARGNVVVVKTDGSRLTTSVLRYDQAANKVTTDQPYVYVSGDRRVEGNGFESDPTFTNLSSRGLRGTGGRFSLPGQ
jgi:LPS export ABC transporter protein LptC